VLALGEPVLLAVVSEVLELGEPEIDGEVDEGVDGEL